MVAHFEKASISAREHKVVLATYACFSAISAAVGFYVLYTSSYWPQGGVPAGLYGFWVVLSVVLAGPLALRLARGWIGLPGSLGWLRAFVGACVSLVVASVVGGTLILPVYGTIYAPLMVLTAVLAQPLVGLIWFAGVFAAHWVVAQADAALQMRLKIAEEKEMAALSPLSQTYFYRK
ncbi:hypothetical protein [Yoonia sp.]|uniref:hypothetical protein n=1 Tax=Yoonia sp. TaxID=2212373 RepID=UPI003A4DC8A9